jgi:hypothetical protein
MGLSMANHLIDGQYKTVFQVFILPLKEQILQNSMLNGFFCSHKSDFYKNLLSTVFKIEPRAHQFGSDLAGQFDHNRGAQKGIFPN